MRRLLVAALVASAVGGVGAGTASAACSTKYEPLCLPDCGPMGRPDVKDPTDLSWLVRTCPDA